MNVVILHGWQGSDAPHWQAWLANELSTRGIEVDFPDLPNRDNPRCEEWLAALETFGPKLNERTTVVAHSLSCILWLHAATKLMLRIDRALLVAPPGIRALEQYQEDMIGFLPVPVNEHAVRSAARETHIICTDNDPFCMEDAAELYAKPLGIDAMRMPSEYGHINATAGLGPWPQMLQLCLAERAQVHGR